MENITSGRFSAGPHHQDCLAALGGVLDSGGLTSLFARLEVAGLLCLQHFTGAIPSGPHTNLDSLHPSIAVEWDWFAAEYIHRTCRLFSHCRQAVVQKNEVEIE